MDSMRPDFDLELSYSCTPSGFSFILQGNLLINLSDLQKHVCLELKPGHLVTTLLWAKIRNPNYFGELLIYTSFLGISLDIRPITAFLVSFIFYWIPNMWLKEKSLSRYEAFAAYKAQSWFLVPGVY